jgi:hypothetical protein
MGLRSWMSSSEQHASDERTDMDRLWPWGDTSSHMRIEDLDSKLPTAVFSHYHGLTMHVVVFKKHSALTHSQHRLCTLSGEVPGWAWSSVYRPVDTPPPNTKCDQSG